MKNRTSILYGLLIFLSITFTSCTPRSIHEAQDVVTQADSLRAVGQIYNDSICLAQAYKTLGQWQLLFPTDYAHACYHYGRLLRQKDNPAEAMQCFINATHTRTHDYHILGRAYSNMGSICHLAGDFPLSYDMYEKSADMFLRNGDTLSYYYGLNDMAFELAEQGEKEEAYRILDKLSNYSNIFLESTVTRAVACKMAKQYDSTIYYTSIALESGYYLSTVILNRAQAYSLMGQKDSAIFYAHMLLANNYDVYDQCNALYILTNDDDSQKIDDIKKNAADRADAQMLIEDRKSQLSQAVQLLEQDLGREPDWRWLYAILVTLVIVGVFLFIYVHYKHKNQTLLTQKIEVLQQATSTIQEQHNELTERYLKSHNQIEEEINHRCSMLRDKDKIIKTLSWKNYHKMCASVDKHFYLLASKLHSKHCLNETEIRLCVLTLLDCGYDQMAGLLYRSSTSIGTLKLRVSKKLGTSSKQLRQYLIDNVCLK